MLSYLWYGFRSKDKSLLLKKKGIGIQRSSIHNTEYETSGFNDKPFKKCLLTKF